MWWRIWIYFDNCDEEYGFILMIVMRSRNWFWWLWWGVWIYLVANAKRGEELIHANKGYHQLWHKPMYTQYACGCTPGMMVNHHTFLGCFTPFPSQIEFQSQNISLNSIFPFGTFWDWRLADRVVPKIEKGNFLQVSRNCKYRQGTNWTNPKKRSGEESYWIHKNKEIEKEYKTNNKSKT